MSWIGHNGGPEMTGAAWRRHCWTHARARLLPKMPLEVVRRRVARAAELGLDYKSYAGIRATTGRDVVAFLFSSNALRMERSSSPAGERLARMRAVRRCDLYVLAQAPHDAEKLADALGLPVSPAPPALARWATARARILDTIRPRAADSVVLVGAAGYERSWAEAARLAAFLPDDRYFADVPPASSI